MQFFYKWNKSPVELLRVKTWQCDISRGEVTFFFLPWHMLTLLRTLSLILADPWWHCSSFKLQISGSDSRSDGSSRPIGWHFFLFRMSRSLFSTEAGCPTRGFEILLCPFIGTSITASPVLNLLKITVVWGVI